LIVDEEEIRQHAAAASGSERERKDTPIAKP
jgi:hypothetical protein